MTHDPSSKDSSAPRRALHFLCDEGEWGVFLNANDPDNPFDVRDHLGDEEVYEMMLEGEPVATCSSHRLCIAHTWSDGHGDHDLYVALRVESILDAKRWGTLPWAEFGPTQLIVAWSHYHDLKSRHDDGRGGFVMGTWVEVESALARGERDLHYLDGKREGG